jgi:hypothetical protein
MKHVRLASLVPASRQQPNRVSFEIIRVLTTRCTHQTPSCFSRSLSEVSTISREGQSVLMRREVHPKLAALVAATPDPFLQTIVDVVVPRTVFGRICLLGDAAFVVRPHTAGASSAGTGRPCSMPFDATCRLRLLMGLA